MNINMICAIEINYYISIKFFKDSDQSPLKLTYYRPPDKNVYWKSVFFISHQKHGYSKDPSQ